MKKITIAMMTLIIMLFQTQSLMADQYNDKDSQAKEVFQSLDWVHGPTSVDIGDNATFSVPEGYVFLNPQDTAKLMDLYQNPPSYNDDYYFGPQDMSWFGVFTYSNTGYISDSEEINADDVFKSIKQGTEQGNKVRIEKGWAPIYIDGWRYEPFYDSDTRRLSWAVDAKSSEELIVNYNTRILGREGVTSAVLVVDPNNLTNTVIDFKKVVEGYKYTSGNTYSDFVEGDKMAEYGLAALIAGGAAAVATKKGFWAALLVFVKVFWKFIIVGIIGLFALIVNLFKRRS